jgi:hypothetical protein
LNSRLFLVSTLLLVCALPKPLFAQTTEVLATGPDQRTGIPFLSANVIPYLHVSYQTAHTPNAPVDVSGTASGIGVQILYTARQIVPYPGWKPAPCGTLGALTVQENPLVYYLSDQSGWSLFMVFPKNYQGTCAFASAFLARFQYFLGITRNSAFSSFPALLQIP